MARTGGWYSDPAGTYEFRWFDGTRWTDDVVHGGVHGLAALPPPPGSVDAQGRPDAPAGAAPVAPAGGAPAAPAGGAPAAPVGGATAAPAGRLRRRPIPWVPAGAIGAAVVLAVAGGILLGRTTRPSGATASVPGATGQPSPTPSGASPAPSATPSPSEPSTPHPTAGPEISIAPPPIAGFAGDYQVVSAQGAGDAETPVFATQGSHLDGTMDAEAPGASFYFVPDGAAFDPNQKPAASCLAPCASGGWAATVPPGRYRLVVRAATDMQWSFTVSERVAAPMTFSVLPTPPAGATGEIPIVHAAGTGDQQSPVFHIGVGSLVGNMTNSGAGSVFWLVPAGQSFNQSVRATASCAGTCASGGWAATVIPGDYYLVVRAQDGWSFEIDELWR